MALDGWHLTAVKPFVYTFRHGNPEKMTYRMDYKLSMDKDYAEYTAIFADCGWELAATMANWHYYRINPGNAATPEIYNTSRSKAQKYRRLLVTLTPIVLISTFLFNPVLGVLSKEQGSLLFEFMKYFGIFMVLVVGFLIYSVIRIALKIRNLESEE